jgi:hypothetical protein
MSFVTYALPIFFTAGTGFYLKQKYFNANLKLDYDPKKCPIKQYGLSPSHSGVRGLLSETVDLTNQRTTLEQIQDKVKYYPELEIVVKTPRFGYAGSVQLKNGEVFRFQDVNLAQKQEEEDRKKLAAFAKGNQGTYTYQNEEE